MRLRQPPPGRRAPKLVIVAALTGSVVVAMNNIKPADLSDFDLAGKPSKLRVTIDPAN